MSRRLFCPHCGTALERPDSGAGESTVCERCGGAFLVPAAARSREITGTSAPAAGSVSLADIEAARARAAELMAENVGLQVELSRRKRHRQRIATALAALERVYRTRQWLDQTLGRLGGFFVVTSLSAAMAFVLVSFFSPGAAGYLLALIAGLGISGAAYLLIAFYPDDATVQSALGPLAARFHAAAASYDEQAKVEAAQRQSLLAAEVEVHRLTAAIDSRLHWLRSCQWREMSDAHFQNFVAEVLVHLGYGVEHAVRDGTQTVDMIALRGGRRTAIWARGGVGVAVAEDAVRLAQRVAALTGCQRAAIVTNAGFTPAAQSLAATANCQLIDAGQIENWIEGRVSL